MKCLEKLSKTHYIVHAHGNNCGKVVNKFPYTIELTYVNKKYFESTPEMNKKALPISGLDFSNNLNYKDIDLNFYPFVHSKIVHSKIVHSKIAHSKIVHSKIVHSKIAHSKIVHSKIVHSKNSLKIHKKLKMKMILQ